MGEPRRWSGQWRLDLVHDDARLAITVPDLLGTLILKAAAAAADTREATRHERDAAVLAALITDHATERAQLHGSDRRRFTSLSSRLTDPFHPAWLALSDDLAVRCKDTLRILIA